MLTANQTTNIILGILIANHIAVLIVGIKTNRTGFCLSILNLIAGLSILFYWIQKQLRIEQHLYDTTDILLIGFEIVLVAFATYFLVSKKPGNWVLIMQYVFFGIHLLALILFCVFMLTFKMKRLV